MNDNDNETLSGPDSTASRTGDETVTGEPGHPAPRPAKNKSNITFFIILVVVVLVVLAMGYMAFGHRKHAAPATPPAVSQPTATPGALPPSTTSSATPPVVAPPVVTPPALTSAAEANALLGGAPQAAPGQMAVPSSTHAPSAVAPGLATPDEANTLLGVPPAQTPANLSSTLAPALPAGASTSAFQGVPPPSAGSVSAPMGHLPVNPAPAPGVASPVIAAQPAPAVLNPAAALAGSPVPSTIAAPAATAAPVAPAAGGVSLESRVTELETRLSNLEAGQARIVDILAHLPPASAAPAEAKSQEPKAVHHPRTPRHKVSNVVKVIPKAKDEAKPSVSRTSASTTTCHLASIVPNRAWTKQPDGTFMTYGIGDRAPNGGIIQTIDPDHGIITDKGKLLCPMVD